MNCKALSITLAVSTTTEVWPGNNDDGVAISRTAADTEVGRSSLRQPENPDQRRWLRLQRERKGSYRYERLFLEGKRDTSRRLAAWKTGSAGWRCHSAIWALDKDSGFLAGLCPLHIRVHFWEPQSSISKMKLASLTRSTRSTVLRLK